MHKEIAFLLEFVEQMYFVCVCVYVFGCAMMLLLMECLGSEQ